MVRLAAQLAWEGHLPSVESMWLRSKDLSDIPRDQLGKLASLVTGWVDINNIKPAIYLDIILERVRCPLLQLENTSLTDPQTRALITAMRDGVERVGLYGDVTLDIEALCQYDGRGTCWEIEVMSDTRTRYGERLRCWRVEVDWELREDRDDWLRMERK